VLVEAGDLCIWRNDPWTEQVLYEAVERAGVIFLRPFLRNGNADTGAMISPPPQAELVRAPRVEEAEALELQRYRLVDQAVAEQLGVAEKQKKPSLALKALVATAAKTLGMTAQEVEDYTRLRVAQGAYKVDTVVRGRKSKKTQEIVLCLSAEGRWRERSRRFVATLASDLVIQADRIGELVEHKPTTGAYREQLLRALLQNNLPERFHVATGFVFGSSRQIDILIYDRLEYAPLFREGDLVVVNPEAVRALIEVKSDLTSAALYEALDLMRVNFIDRNGGPPVFRGVFGYKGAQTSTLRAATLDYYQGLVDAKGQALIEPKEEQRIQNFYDPVTAICVLGQSLIALDFAREENGSCLRPFLYELNNRLGRAAQAAMFIELLMDHLRQPLDGERSDPWMYRLLHLERETANAQWIEPSCDWGPYAGPIDPSGLELEGLVRAQRHWRAGEAWSTN